MSYRSGAGEAHLSSKGYLELLDRKLGFPQGTLYNLCVGAIKSKVQTKSGVAVTYRGEAVRKQRLAPHKSRQLRKAVFLIEYRMNKSGKECDRVVQVHLEM